MSIADGPAPPGGGVPRAGRAASRRPARDPNRLHRRTGLLEDGLSWLLGVAIAAGVFAVVLAGGSAHDSMVERGRQEAAERVPVTAVLVEEVPVVIRDGRAKDPGAVRYVAPDGIERIGTVELPAGKKAGTTVPVWSTRGGELVSAPVTGADATAVAVMTGVLFALGWGTGCSVLARLMGRWTSRRYALSWEREWADVEPEWSGRRGTRPGDEV